MLNIINLSFSTGIVHPICQAAVIKLFLKKPGLSNLPISSAVLESIVANQKNNHLVL